MSTLHALQCAAERVHSRPGCTLRLVKCQLLRTAFLCIKGLASTTSGGLTATTEYGFAYIPGRDFATAAARSRTPTIPQSHASRYHHQRQAHYARAPPPSLLK